MMRYIVLFLTLITLTLAVAKGVEPGSLQAQQAQKFVRALGASSTTCSAPLLASESTFLCASFTHDAPRFRTVIDAESAASKLEPIGPWAAYQGEEGQQRSFLYKDGFMTVSYIPSGVTPTEALVVVQYVIPHD